MPFIKRFSDIKKGGIVFTGNTLGLSKSANSNSPGTLGSIGAFTSLNASLQVGTFPPSTTLNYLLNGSYSYLNLPLNSIVKYAELIWGGLFKSTVNNISNLINNSITFTTPLGNYSVLPDSVTAQTFNILVENTSIGFYVRSANVTQLVASALNGKYSVSSVPSLIEAIDSRTAQTNHAGWTLAVVYENANSILQNLTLWVGGAVVTPNTGSTDITISGFITPEALPVNGKIFISAQEGDAVISGDQMLFGSNVSSLSNLSGVNNPSGNFFASQINDINGNLDTTGSFGTRNAISATGTNTSACRQGWDITTADLNNKLTINQTSAAIRFTTTGDLYVPNALGLQIESKGADISVIKSADKSFVEVSKEVTFYFILKNEGNIQATNIILNDILPTYLNFKPDSIILNGLPYSGTLPVKISKIDPGEVVLVSFSVIAQSVPPQNPIANQASVTYEFYPFSGFLVETSKNSNSVNVNIIENSVNLVKSVNKNYAIKDDILIYDSIIKNDGNLTIYEVYFQDNIPTGCSFISGSVEINGVAYPSYNPQNGFYLADILPMQSTNVSFKVIIN